MSRNKREGHYFGKLNGKQTRLRNGPWHLKIAGYQVRAEGTIILKNTRNLKG